jgi:hypothetical protein
MERKKKEKKEKKEKIPKEKKKNKKGNKDPPALVCPDLSKNYEIILDHQHILRLSGLCLQHNF